MKRDSALNENPTKSCELHNVLFYTRLKIEASHTGYFKCVLPSGDKQLWRERKKGVHSARASVSVKGEIAVLLAESQ